MKILFFGGTGLIGKNFYKFCKYKNFKIDIVSRKKPQFKLRKTDNWFSYDITTNKLLNFSKDYDVIIIGTSLSAKDRFAKKFSNADFYKINVEGIKNIIKQIKNINFNKLIFLSSGIVYGRYNKKNPSEKDRIKFNKKDQLNHYSISKIKSEKEIIYFCKKMKKNFLILRIFSIIDFKINYDNSGYVINLFLKSAKVKNCINISDNPNNKISYLDINTFNEIIVKFLKTKLKNTVFNIGSDNILTILNLAKIISKLFKKKITINLPKKNKPQTNYIPNIDKLKKTIKFKKTLSVEQICRRIKVNLEKSQNLS